MLGLSLITEMFLASSQPHDDVHIWCKDSSQLSTFAQQVMLPLGLNETLQWTPQSYSQISGIEHNANLHISASKERRQIDVDFKGDTSQIEAMVQLLKPDARVSFTDDSHFIIFETDDLSYGLVNETGFRISNMQDIETSPVRVPDILLGYPAEGGCGIYMGSQMSSSRMAQSEVSLYIPYSMGPLRFQFHSPDLNIPDLMPSEDVVLPEVVTTASPLAVVNLRVSPIDILSDESVPPQIQISEYGQRTLNRKLKIPGVSLGVFSLNREEPDVLLVVPVTTKRGHKSVRSSQLIRWMRRLSKKTGWEMIEEGAFTGRMERGEESIWYEAIDGEVYFVTQKQRLESLSPEGQPWKNDETLGEPLSIQFHLPNMMTLALGGLAQVHLGISSENDLLSAQISSRSMNGDSGLKALLAIANNRFPLKNYEGFLQESDESDFDKSSELFVQVKNTLRDIALYTHETPDKAGKFSGMDCYTSNADTLDTPSLHPQSMASNGWRPSTHIEGTYWVELRNEGGDYRVHGYIMDNETPKHWVRDNTGTLYEESISGACISTVSIHEKK